MRLDPALTQLVRLLRVKFFLALIATSTACLADQSAPLDRLEIGRQIFLKGQLPNGEALRTKSLRGRPLSGRQLACANCHRPSGMGGKLARNPVPAITGKYLLQPSPASGQTARPAYDDASLARTIRQGVDSAGRRLDETMPRYQNLDDAAMQALLAYLKQLGTHPDGVSSHLHFATVFTPDVPQTQRTDSLAVLQACMASGSSQRPWQLDVWELSGAAQDWPRQLQQQLTQKPVLALLGGGGENWQPVQSFCAEQRLPCLFPQVDAPPAENLPTYSLYLSGGVKTEAAVLARMLPPDSTGIATPAGRGGRAALPGLRALAGIKRIVQIHHEGAGGEAAASLAKALTGRSQKIETLTWRESAAATLANLPPMDESDLLLLWLRSEDLHALLAGLPTDLAARRILISDTLANADRFTPPEHWQSRLGILSLFELKEKRQARNQFVLKPWLQKRGLTLHNERSQMAALSACALLAGAVGQAGEDISRDYLLESVITTAGSRGEPSHHPELRMAPGQTHASRGGRLLRYTTHRAGTTLSDESGWVVP